MLAERILAALLHLAPAGQSVYSVVEAAPDEPAPCSEPRITCRAPWRDVVGEHGPRGRLIRYEQPAEALVRYRTIAAELAAVVLWSTGQCDGDARNEACSGEHGAEGWPAPRGDWRWEPLDLARFMAAVVFHESRMARAVHAGEGAAARSNGVDWCLGQIHLGRTGKRRGVPLMLVQRRGWTAEDLDGVDALSTRRCLVIVADGLSRVRVQRGGSPWSVFLGYGGVPKGASEETMRRINARVWTWTKLGKLLGIEGAPPS